LARMYPEHDYPSRAALSDAELWNSFCEEWDRDEGRRGVSRNFRPSKSTVLRTVGRKT
jgi:hypothetical protein